MDCDDSSRTLSAASVQSEDTITADLDDLSPEQIDFLLQRAALRLKSKNGTPTITQSASRALPKLTNGSLPASYTYMDGAIARTKDQQLLGDSQRRLAETPKKVEDPVVAKKKTTQKSKESLADWYNLPRTELTPDLKRDLQLLNMRSVLDPKRMYKKQGKFKIPEYSQVGVIVEGPGEFFSGRIENKQRKKTFVEEVLAGEADTGRFKSKYEEVQISKRSGKKGYYKALQARRKKTPKG